MITLRFDDGTLTCEGLAEHHALVADLCAWDERVQRHRALALHYAEILRRLHGKAAYDD
ncbi:MAG: hypothetical protein H0W83_05715, partial [Planctomycetes bacterium]|nr:hypothetical protein [Planctomycetota bacterium]